MYHQPDFLPAGIDPSLVARFERHLCNTKRADDRSTKNILSIASSTNGVPLLNPTAQLMFWALARRTDIRFFKAFNERTKFSGVRWDEDTKSALRKLALEREFFGKLPVLIVHSNAQW